MIIKNELLKKAYEGSYYTIIGAGGDLEEWKHGYSELLAESGIGSVKEWISFKGSDMNKEFGLTGSNMYDPSLTFLAFPSDGLNVGRLAIFKLQMEDHWFDDIVENNLRREAEKEDVF